MKLTDGYSVKRVIDEGFYWAEQPCNKNNPGCWYTPMEGGELKKYNICVHTPNDEVKEYQVWFEYGKR